MTIEQDEDFILGQNVTDIAAGKGEKSVMLSVRLSPEDFIRLERLCEDSGKTLSEVVREAVEFYSAAEPVADGTAALPGAVVGVSTASR